MLVIPTIVDCGRRDSQQILFVAVCSEHRAEWTAEKVIEAQGWEMLAATVAYTSGGGEAERDGVVLKWYPVVEHPEWN